MAIARIDWSELPLELVEEIILRIDWPEDVLRFSRVCQAWFAAFTRARRKWTPANPWLLLPEYSEYNPECIRKAHNPANGNCYLFKLPQTFGKNCWGSNLGWIVTYGLDLEINIFNPLTKIQLHLPSTDTMMPQQFISVVPDYEHCNRECEFYPHWMTQLHITKAFVFKTRKSINLYDDGADDNDGLFVAVIHVHEHEHDLEDYTVKSTCLSIARPGDTRWTLIETPKKTKIRDVLLWKDLLWFVDLGCSLWYVDLSRGGPSYKAIEFLLKPQILIDNKIFSIRGSAPYLVESSNHELLLAMRFGTRTTNDVEDDRDDYLCPLYFLQNRIRKILSANTKRFVICKLNLISKKWEAAAASDLGKSTLFLGKCNTSLVDSASKEGSCKSNCIYFAGDHVVTSGHDMGIYNLDRGMIESFYDGDDTESDVCNPFWFTPLLF